MRVSRRGFVMSIAAALPTAALPAEITAKGRTFPSVAARYLDPATEFQVIRLTDPQHSSVLPSSYNRVLTARTMLYASDQTGRWEAFRMDLKNRESRQITDAADLDISSLAFTPGAKGFWHFDGEQLLETALHNLKTREIYRIPEGGEKLPGTSYSDDGQHAAFVERANGKYRLLVVHLSKGTSTTLLEAPEEIRDVMIRPKRASVFYRIGDDARVINLNGQQSRRLALAEGEIGQVQWSSDGRALLYLHRPPSGKRLTSLREFQPDADPDGASDSFVANTTQFVRFCANGDASVFAGASGSKASPYILLLTRVAKRELTLAEHRASDALFTTPVFAPNSQFVVFGSDRHGKRAIYWIAVDKFVADTEGS